jgi:hypothetical protein
MSSGAKTFFEISDIQEDEIKPYPKSRVRGIYQIQAAKSSYYISD